MIKEYLVTIILVITILSLIYFINPEPFIQYILSNSQRPLFISDSNQFASIYIYRGIHIVIFYVITFIILGIAIYISSSLILKEWLICIHVLGFILYAQISSFIINEFDLSYTSSINAGQVYKHYPTDEYNLNYSWWNIFERGDAISFRDQYIGVLQDLFIYFIIYNLFSILIRIHGNIWFIDRRSSVASLSVVIDQRSSLSEASELLVPASLNYYINTSSLSKTSINNKMAIKVINYRKTQIIVWLIRIINVVPLFYFIGGEGYISDRLVLILSIVCVEIFILIIRFFSYLKSWNN